MAERPSRRDAAPDPIRQQLVEVRRGLLRLHKALIDAEREVYERRHGALTSGQLLQALIENPYFAWLRPFSGLLVEIDEALAADEPMTGERARGFLERVRLLVAAGEDEDDAGPAGRYQEVLHRHPDVLVAHVELHGRLRPP